MKRHGWMIVAMLLGLGLWSLGCEITADYPEMDSKPEPTLCETDDDCLEGVCDPSTGTCVECVADSACPVGKHCNPDDKQCVTCYLDAQCATGVCDEAAGICRECQTEADCSSGQCDTTTGVCIECGANDDCVSTDPCKVGVCVAGRCSFGEMPDGVVCNDGNECTAGDFCQAGVCTGEEVPGCENPTDPCAYDASGAGVPEGTPCDDGNPCTLDDYCYLGKCVGDTISSDCTEDDLDGDGYSVAEGDCNDLDGAVSPAMPESCDNIDNNCDGLVDENCSGECIVSGCNGELCVGAPMRVAEPTDCDWLPEYECLVYTTCGPYAPGGTCGWIKTAEYVDCLNNLQVSCSASAECPEGQTCMEGLCVVVSTPCSTDADCGYQEVCMNGECTPYTTQCTDMGGVDLGACDMFLGYAPADGECVGLSGCGCGEYCAYLFGSLEECEATCFGTNPCNSAYECASGEVCVNGACVAVTNECEASGGMCVYGDFAEPTCPVEFYAVDYIGCDMGICCLPGGCSTTPEICNGIDDDCDGIVDEDVCTVCDDGNPCTYEYEDPTTGACYSEERNCDDGNECTMDYCDVTSGACFYETLDGCDMCSADEGCPAGMMCVNGQCLSTTNGCFSDSQCASGQYCYFSDCAVETGACTTVPQACSMVFSPVCGCNGLTYGNLCLLMQSKQDLAYAGSCGANIEDADGDGFGYDTDCDDTNVEVHPGAAESCDGLDNDCDGLLDESCSGAPCAANSDCAAGQVCMAGVCVILPN